MIVVAAYDVSEDSRRARLAALLQSVGDRVQKSVYVLSLDSEDLAVLREKMGTIIDPERDSVYVFRQCASCWEILDFLGQADPPRPVLYWSVL